MDQQTQRPRRASRYADTPQAPARQRTKEYTLPADSGYAPYGSEQPQQAAYRPAQGTATNWQNGYPPQPSYSQLQANGSPMQQGNSQPQMGADPSRQAAPAPQPAAPARQVDSFPQRRARTTATPARPVPTPAARFTEEEQPQPQPRYQASAEPRPVARTHARRQDIEAWDEGEARPARRVREKTSTRMPRALTAGMSLMLLVCMALLAAHGLMSAYLTRQREAREAAYQQVVNSHPLDYRAYIERYAAEYNLQPAFVAAIILNESSYNPSATSSVGARGLMQLMEDTADWINGKLNVSGYSFQMMYDPETNIRFGCWYLNYLSKMFGGDPVCVSSAYHAGQGTVSNWLQNGQLRQFGGNEAIEAMPEGPTKVYAGRVTRAYGIYDALYYQAYNSVADDADAALAADAARR